MKPKLGLWWNRKGASTLEYIVVISAVVILAMALYHTLNGSEVAGTIKEKVQAAILGESSKVATGPSGNESSGKESEPKKEKAPSQKAKPAPKKKKEENKAVKFAKGAAKVGLDFVGFYDAKAAITGVDEDGNKIGVGERIFRGALVIPAAKPVKGVKMAVKYGGPALKAGKKNLNKVAGRGKKAACGCPKKKEKIHKGKSAGSALNAPLKGFKTRTFRIGDHTIYLTKKDMVHFLERHHPKYFDKKQAKKKNTQFDRDMTVDDILNSIDGLMKQNRDEINSQLSKGKNQFQIQGHVNGRKYQLGFKYSKKDMQYRIGQFTPIE